MFYNTVREFADIVADFTVTEHLIDLISFPHHRHLENTEVTASTERNLPEIFLAIREALKKYH